MSKYIPEPETIIAVRLMHLGHIEAGNFAAKAEEIIKDLRIYGYEIVIAKRNSRDAPIHEDDSK